MLNGAGGRELGPGGRSDAVRGRTTYWRAVSRWDKPREIRRRRLVLRRQVDIRYVETSLRLSGLRRPSTVGSQAQLSYVCQPYSARFVPVLYIDNCSSWTRFVSFLDQELISYRYSLVVLVLALVLVFLVGATSS